MQGEIFFIFVYLEKKIMKIKKYVDVNVKCNVHVQLVQKLLSAFFWHVLRANTRK